MLESLGIAVSSWYHDRVPPEARRPRGPKQTPVPREIETAVLMMATNHPWYGYKRIAVMCRRAGHRVTNRQCYRVMKTHDLLQKRKARAAEIYQATKLYELLPAGPNELWQMDVTYIHIPGRGWWYAVTVIDYYSRYLLAAHLTSSYSALEATNALRLARAEAERIHGPLTKNPFLVTDNGPTFIARRFMSFVQGDYTQVRIAYRTPTQLGLLERFHRTLKEEEVYWRLYDDPAHARACLAEFRTRYNTVRPHWALVPEAESAAEVGSETSAEATGEVASPDAAMASAALPSDPVTPLEVYDGRVRPQLPKWQAWARKAKEKLDELHERPAA